MIKTKRRESSYKKAGEESEGRVTHLTPLNDKQAAYIEAMDQYVQTIVCGFSGTGKTYLAASYAANLYLTRQVDKIIITRPNVSVGRELGHLPGELNDKFAPWAAPVIEVLNEKLGKGKVMTDIKNGNIEMAPLSTMRGRSFKDAFVILDEAQNTTIPEIKMFLTRIGKNCKVVINGDVKQSDIYGQSGLAKIIEISKKYDMSVPVIEFGIEDIVRSGICKEWIIGFEGEGL